MTVVRAPQGWDPSRYVVERFTGIASGTLTLANAPIAGLEQVVKNGSELYAPTAYTLSGRTVTLTVASVVGDTWTVRYWMRPNRGT